VDQVEQGHLRIRKDQMIEAGGSAPEEPEEQTTRSITGNMSEFQTDNNRDQ
jgi:hypothetical protein